MWIKKKPPAMFADWLWDSRRPLAIKGTGDDFRREMTVAYRSMSDHMPGLQIVMFTHQDASVWADMAAIVWGTVLLVLRKRSQQESVYQDELVQEVRAEVARQIETMTGLNQPAKGAGHSENLFEDQDLQMAGYAAALRVLTGYSRIDGQDMAAVHGRPQAATSLKRLSTSPCRWRTNIWCPKGSRMGYGIGFPVRNASTCGCWILKQEEPRSWKTIKTSPRPSATAITRPSLQPDQERAAGVTQALARGTKAPYPDVDV